MTVATYSVRPVQNDKSNGTFFYPRCCGSRLYSVRDKWAYNGALCPTCMQKHKKVVLFLDESNQKEKLNG